MQRKTLATLVQSTVSPAGLDSPLGGVVAEELAGSHSPALLWCWFQLPASAAGVRQSAPRSCPQTPRFVSDGERCARWQQNTPEEAIKGLWKAVSG